MSFLDKLNLRPHERRLLVGVGFLIFLVLNVWFVWPYFGHWKMLQSRKSKALATLKLYKEEIGRTNILGMRLKELRTEGSDTFNEELQLGRFVQAQASATGVQLTTINPRPRASGGRTNQFWEEQALTVDYVNTGGKELVDFLVKIANGSSMVRVREMSIQPESSQIKLKGNIYFVASYQKKPSTNAPAAVAPRKIKPK